MRRNMALPPALILPLLLVGCHTASPVGYLSCEGPVRPTAPSSAYAGRSTAELESLASNGDLAAARVLGERYQHGEGVPVDMKQAARWFEQAAIVPAPRVPVFIPGFGKTPPTVTEVSAGPATLGDPIALSELGALYASGQGVPLNPGRAQHLQSCAALHRPMNSSFTSGEVPVPDPQIEREDERLETTIRSVLMPPMTNRVMKWCGAMNVRVGTPSSPEPGSTLFLELIRGYFDTISQITPIHVVQHEKTITEDLSVELWSGQFDLSEVNDRLMGGGFSEGTDNNPIDYFRIHTMLNVSSYCIGYYKIGFNSKILFNKKLTPDIKSLIYSQIDTALGFEVPVMTKYWPYRRNKFIEIIYNPAVEPGDSIETAIKKLKGIWPN